ncbi:unnamed protein product [Mesocestoides corti]|uniref:BAH domain-containing protein n=2 Tax=Mesocestoides corti TaxID=53468 RepID=A0A0R3U7Y7_MESCO|nr:unnamed protein product [Mesocestoides corti]
MIDHTRLLQDYPRTLAVSLAVHNVAAVFRDDVSRHDYWSLGTEDDQFLTDEFAIIHRRDYETSSACLENDRPPLAFASEAIVVRIYRLWKDTDGKSWMEGGAFLRPYDLPSSVLSTTDALWHPRELVYDETSRLVLPLSALRGRCSVLSPSIYRLGRPADLPAVLRSGGGENDHHDPHPLVFLCERLMTKNSAGELLFQDIAPAYLKVTMKPYYFLRHPESSALRAAIVRSSTPSELSALDAVAPLGEIVPSGVESGKLFAPFCKRRWRETEEEPVEESKAEDSSSVWTNEPPSMGQRKTGRSLDAVLARLKPIPLPTNTANTNGTFHHGPRKSQCVKLISSSHGSSTSKSPTKKRSRGLSTSASKPSVTTLTFMQLQQQIALGDDTLTKEAASPVTTPKRRGRKPKPVTFGPLRDDDVDEQIEFEECADVSSPSSPKEAVVADITEEEGVVHTCDSLVVEVLCHVATADDPVSDELLPPPEVLEEPAVQIVSAVDFGGPEECLPVCCDQVVMETPPLATLDVIVHECVGSVSTPVEGNDAATAVAHASSPPAHEIAHARPTPRILHAEFEATPEAVLDIHPVFESVEFLESMPFLVEGVANTMLQAQITSSCVLKEPETCLRQNFEDAYQPISSSSESSSEGSVDVVNDDSRRLKTVWVRTSDGDEQEDSKEQRRSNLSSSRRRKGSSPKKRVFEDPEFVLDLSAKSSGDE